MTTLSDEDLGVILEFSVSLAKKAGAVILEGSKTIKQRLAESSSGAGAVDSKLNSVDLVTEWDVKVEEIVSNEIRQRYPNFGFIGEESYSKGVKPPLTEEPTFCVDPIDGTTNFVHGFPFACISIGLIYQKKPVIGVIYNPFLDQLYSARTSKGAFLNGTVRLPLSRPAPLPSLSSALIGVEWGSERSSPVMGNKSRSFVRLAGNFDEGVVGGQMAHSLRSIGSAALNYCLVASGSLDIYWEVGCWPWDVCAGIVIAQEAGAFISGSSATSPHDGNVTEDILQGRKYIVVRAIGDTADEVGHVAQVRTVKQFYECVEDWDPK